MNRSPDTNIISVSPKVNGTPLRVELDTGSAVFVIKQFDEYFTSLILKTYSGEEISPLGIMLNITDNDKSCHCFFVKNGGPALFGRQ